MPSRRERLTDILDREEIETLHQHQIEEGMRRTIREEQRRIAAYERGGRPVRPHLRRVQVADLATMTPEQQRELVSALNRDERSSEAEIGQPDPEAQKRLRRYLERPAWQE